MRKAAWKAISAGSGAGAACYARDARVTRNSRWSQLVTIDIIRRDTLAAKQSVASPLVRHGPRARPVPGKDLDLADTGQR